MREPNTKHSVSSFLFVCAPDRLLKWTWQGCVCKSKQGFAGSGGTEYLLSGQKGCTRCLEEEEKGAWCSPSCPSVVTWPLAGMSQCCPQYHRKEEVAGPSHWTALTLTSVFFLLPFQHTVLSVDYSCCPWSHAFSCRHTLSLQPCLFSSPWCCGFEGSLS